MTRFDHNRLTHHVVHFDRDGLRHGIYSDKYFVNVMQILDALRRENYIFSGQSPRAIAFDPGSVGIGSIEVEAQIFNRRAPFAIIAGLDLALVMLRHAAGNFAEDTFGEAWQSLDVMAVHDGDITHYGGHPNEVKTVIEIRGPYSAFTLLETPILGALSRGSRIATNVYHSLQAANGKPIFFFPARFDLPEVQSLDGYAYWVALQRYNHETGKNTVPMVSTDAQAAWWGGSGGGTVPHAIIACFLADTAETMIAFARHMPVTVPRIALVDFNNDTVAASLATLNAYWPFYRAALEADDPIEQQRWTLNGVRLDTSGNMLDRSLREGDPTGVSPLLVRVVREAINNAWIAWDVPAELEDAARSYCHNVQIVVSGGFDAEKIRLFETQNTPVDAYGVGSSLLRNDKITNTDFTMDVVRVKIDGNWVDMAKTGRAPGDNPDLSPVDLKNL